MVKNLFISKMEKSDNFFYLKNNNDNNKKQKIQKMSGKQKNTQNTNLKPVKET